MVTPLAYTPSRESVRAEFERHVARSYRTIYRHAFRLLRDKGDAEEVTQDAFLRAWKHYDSFDGVRRFENWMLRIVTNLVIDRRRRHRHTTCSLDAAITMNSDGDQCKWEAEAPHADPEEIVLEQVVHPALEHALSELSSTFRNVLLMADVQDYTYSEIARALRCPIGTVRSRLRRARMQMRRSLESRGYEHADTMN
jgi:RNA polymerase sigma-70 factor, ECF subfamily